MYLSSYALKYIRICLTRKKAAPKALKKRSYSLPSVAPRLTIESANLVASNLDLLKITFKNSFKSSQPPDFSPLFLGQGAAFGRTTDDVLLSFLRWSTSESGSPDVPRANARLLKFHAFLHKHKKTYFDSPVIPSLEPNFIAISSALQFMIPEWTVSLTDNSASDCILWVIDFEKLDRRKLAGIPDRSLFRW